MITILGAGGAISSELVPRLAARGERIRLVARHPAPAAAGGNIEVVAADISRLDDTVKAVAGSSVVFLLAGLKYDIRVWREFWPAIMRNAIEASKRAGARLVFFDNVYMYGKVDGPMTEQTPFRPSSRKGEVRAQIATALLDEMKAGSLTAMIARSADFYGPGARTGIPNVLVFEKLAHGATPMCLGSDRTRHSCTFTPNAAQALLQLMDSNEAWNQTWHLPTAPDALTGKEFIALAAREFNRPPKYRLLRPFMVKLAGLFDGTIREIHEMLYQNEYDYIFDSSKFARAFRTQATSYADGIRLTAASYKSA